MLVIIIVSWNVVDLLRRCLESLAQYPAISHPQHVIVVDNASPDGSADMVRSSFPNVTLIANQTNRYFTGGNNDGLVASEQVLQKSGNADDYVLFLNPDTEVTADALDSMLRYADQNADIALIGPQLLNADNTVQSSRRRFPTLLTAIFESTWLQPLAPRSLLARFYMTDHSDSDICDVDWVTGAAMLTRRSVLRKVGHFDEANFLMYSEEVDLCRRVKMDATLPPWRIVYFPPAKIIHYEARSSMQVSARRMILFNMSKVRYMRKHHGALRSELLRYVLLAQFAWQVAIEGMKWLLGSQRHLRSERISAYVDVLRNGLI